MDKFLHRARAEWESRYLPTGYTVSYRRAEWFDGDIAHGQRTEFEFVLTPADKSGEPVRADAELPIWQQDNEIHVAFDIPGGYSTGAIELRSLAEVHTPGGQYEIAVDAAARLMARRVADEIAKQEESP